MSRHIDFEGIENFRDFGGYATACGRGLRRGRLYRSANHHRASDADLARLRALGVAVIVDLRRADEREREPSRRWDGFDGAVVENDFAQDHPDWDPKAMPPDPTPEWFHEYALSFYRQAPHEPRHVDLFRRYFRALAEADGAVVVHCAAGKDRTGLICALTHHIAGVHPDDLLADYLLTNDEARLTRKMAHLGGWLEQVLGRPLSDTALRAAVSVRADYLAAAFGAIEAAHGSVDGYLGEVLGVGAAARARLHDRLLG